MKNIIISFILILCVPVFFSCKNRGESHRLRILKIDSVANVFSFGWLHDVKQAELWCFLPDSTIDRKDASVLIMPGGAYVGLAFVHEGIELAEWLRGKGYSVFLLKYRAAHGDKHIPINDAYEAMKYIRANADSLGIGNKLGVMGFSAGGHLVAIVSNSVCDKENQAKPDFSILCYPVITTKGEFQYTHKILLGSDASSEELYNYSLENMVSSDTPPSLIFVSEDDTDVPPENSLLYYEALQKHNIDAELHIYPSGGHGWGMKQDFEYRQDFLTSLEDWLSKQ